MNTELKNAVKAADLKAQYDARVKRLVGHKRILAQILIKTVDEFKGMNPKAVADCIEGTPYISTVPVEPGLTNAVLDRNGQRIVGFNTENQEINEGLARFDIVFYVRTKDGLSQIIINVEAQKDEPGEYEILNRAIFYVSRLVSSQKERDFENALRPLSFEDFSGQDKVVENLRIFVKAARLRGEDTGFFYNCFCRMTGVEDKLTYLNELYQFRLELKNSGRNMLILEREIPVPTMEEISAIRRNTYNNVEQMLFDLSVNIKYSQNIELQRLMNQAFIDIMLEELEISGMNVNRLTNKAVYLLCWLKRYQKELFEGWEMPKIGCFIYLGGCRNENEALFVRMLARLPVDVLILNPNQDTACCLSDKLLYEIHYTESLAVEHFPNEGREVQMGTAAYHAERELDTIMYQDSGIYRNQQYGKANAVMLRTMYEEIPILWDQEVKYRPNFSVTDSVVNIPVIFAKVSGVKDGQLAPYWSGIKSLMTEETYVISKAPFIESTDANPIKAHATEFYKNNRLQREKIKSHPVYRYGVLREEMQDYILDKLGLLIAQKTIRGTGENGTEYTIISTVLNMNKDIIRMIQKFDFTKKNPKLIYINTTETVISLEDSILTAFLSLLGFDVVFFVPTGYQSVEKYFNTKVMEEHQIGEYLYDLQVPNFELIPSGTRQSWRDRLFKRGG